MNPGIFRSPSQDDSCLRHTEPKRRHCYMHQSPPPSILAATLGPPSPPFPFNRQFQSRPARAGKRERGGGEPAGGGRGAGLSETEAGRGGREAAGGGREGARAAGPGRALAEAGAEVTVSSATGRPGGQSWRQSRSLRGEGLGPPQRKRNWKARRGRRRSRAGQSPGAGRGCGRRLPLALVRSPEWHASPTTRSNARAVPGGRPLQNWSPGLHRGPRASPGGRRPGKVGRAPGERAGDSLPTALRPRRRAHRPRESTFCIPSSARRDPGARSANRPRARGRARSADFWALDDPALARGAPPSLPALLAPVCTSARASAPVPGTQCHGRRAFPQSGPRPQSVLLAPQPWGGRCSAPAAAGVTFSAAGLLGPAVGSPVGFRCPLLGAPRFARGR
nr:translation initiation factor IF-2-like [Mirounga angustirostris]